MKEEVKLLYKDGKVYVTGSKTQLLLELSSKELRKMYFGKEGVGTLTIVKK